MATSKPKMVTAVFRDRVNAELAHDRLLSHGYTSNEINVLMSDATRNRYYPSTTASEAPRGASSDATAGMGIGGAIGTAVGASLAAVAAIGVNLVIPGSGLVIAGPAAAALVGAGAGAVTGGIIGALVGWGIPEPNARAYEEALNQGGMVIGVIPRSSEDASTIKRDFEDLHGESVCYC